VAYKSQISSFTQSWNQTAAWAKSHGISSSTYYPVYQKDATRVLNGYSPMSTSERTRAILSAANPNNVTPVPSDHPSPWSFIGNAVHDVRNIFTGLAPNHLVPNVFHTVESAVVHPTTWLMPMEEWGKGLLTGNWSEMRKSLKDANNSVLSWVPGVWAAQQFAQGGPAALAEKPISTMLDLVPFAPVGRVLSLAASDTRIGAMAAKVGMTPDEFLRASGPKMGARYMLTRSMGKIAEDGSIQPRFPGIGKVTKDLLVRPVKAADGQVAGYRIVSLSDVMKHWVQTHTGVSKDSAAMAAAAFDLRNYGTQAQLYTERPFQLSLEALTPDERTQLWSLDDKSSPLAQGKSVTEILYNDAIPEQVRDAYAQLQDIRDLGVSRAMASGGIVSREGPDYKAPNGQITHDTEYFGVHGESHAVVAAADAFNADLANLMKAMGPAHRITQEVEQWDTEAEQLLGSLEESRKEAEQVVLEGRTEPVPVQLNKKGTRVTQRSSLELAPQADLLFGDKGLIAQIGDAGSTRDAAGRPKQRDFQTMKALTQAAKKSLSHDGYASIDSERSPVFAKVLGYVQAVDEYATKRVARERQFLNEITKEGSTGFKKQLKKAIKSYRKFEDAWWKNPPDRWRSVLYDQLVEQILNNQDKVERIGEMDKSLRERRFTAKQMEDIHSDPKVLAQLIWEESKMAASNVNGRLILDHQDIQDIYDSAVEQVNKLRLQGLDVQYTPVVTSLDLAQHEPGRYGVTLPHQAKARDLSSTKGRVMSDFMPERYDVLAALHVATKEALQRDIAIEFATTQIEPKALTAGDVAEWAQRAFPARYSGAAGVRSVTDVTQEAMARDLGLVRWDPELKMGFSWPKWDGQDMYLPAGFAKAVDSLLEKGQFPLDGIYDKATGVFRTAILGLSPRYTAHIVFGGSMLLALRSSYRIAKPGLIADAYRMVKHGEMPTRIIQGATERGLEPVSFETFKDEQKLNNVALTAANRAGGESGGTMMIQRELTLKGIDWKKARPDQWLKAAADVNFRFTNWVSNIQRSLAYLDGYEQALKSNGKFIDETGASMSADRAKEAGIQHALKVMGDLKAMSPFERVWMTRIMPFYGWTRHILNYVLTYPVDHPYRAQFLTVLANQSSDSVANALDKRILFMFFLGSPDNQGNVKGVDVRFMDPFRDVANYATLGGWISALNPVIAAPLVMADPNILYGGQSLYPNVTYDQFYGIETASSQGNMLNAAEQIVPQLQTLDVALNLSGQYRNLSTSNPTAFFKQIFNALNVPFAQVQNLNMKQLAAKGEMARYQVAKQLSTNAWQTGDFSAIQNLPTVPDPVNTEYDITPSALEALYHSLAAQYPGLPPSETATPPPSLPL
jgi:hypothetical protein